MFAPLLPIQSDSRDSATVDSLLAQVDAIGTVIAVLGRWAGRDSTVAVPGLSERAALAAWLTEADGAATAHVAAELGAIGAGLQAGFAAIERARRQGKRAAAVAALLQRESCESLAQVLRRANGDRRTG